MALNCDRHKLNDTGMYKLAELTNAFITLGIFVANNNVTGRELAIVDTKLEEAMFFAVKGFVNSHPEYWVDKD